jgi:hypothetical protein
MSNESIPTNLPPTAAVIGVMTPPPGTIATYERGIHSQIQTQFTMNLDQDALISIAVAEAEKQIRQKVADLQRQSNRLQSRLNTLINQRDTFLASWTQNQVRNDEPLARLITAASFLLTRTPIPNYNLASYQERSSTILGRVGYNQDSFEFVRIYEIPAPESFLELLFEIKEASASLEESKREILGARTALNNVDALERQAKARMASKVAENTPGGRELVESILATINADSLIDTLRI